MKSFLRSAPTASSVTRSAQRCFFAGTPARLGLDQLQDMPTSTPRKPGGPHRGPGKRQVSKREENEWQYMKMWELTMKGEWDDLEPFKSLPKPKKQFGNEAAEIVWPYALLLQKYVKVHPFTKSIYVYYGQKQMTEEGKARTEIARRFAWEYLTPITFHNSQCYVETEMLVGYCDAPWVVVHCLDGRSLCIPVDAKTAGGAEATADDLLTTVLAKAQELGAGTKDAAEMFRVYNDRPLQNQYVRVDYQWMGETAEDRMAHLTRWDWNPRDADLVPKVRHRDASLLTWLNADGGLPPAATTRMNMVREKARHRRAKVVTGPRSFFNSGQRQHATTGRFGGPVSGK